MGRGNDVSLASVGPKWRNPPDRRTDSLRASKPGGGLWMLKDRYKTDIDDLYWGEGDNT